MNRIHKLDVFYHNRKVGTLATTKDKRIAFSYDAEWLAQGFIISPFSLPLKREVFIPRMEPFEGVYGVFADSLPDGWGRLLLDRFLVQQGENPASVDNLTRLAIVGSVGLGALEYRPSMEMEQQRQEEDWDTLSEKCHKVLQSEYVENLDELVALGGSSGGARPKVMTKYKGEEWIIKFPATMDREDIGELEYRYNCCAKKCGIEVAETRLFESKKCSGYFGTKRFDRIYDEQGKEQKIHMISVSAVLETSHRIPNLDYHILMKLTLELTKDYQEVEKMFRWMCFNVFAHNRDDHSKNFSYLYDEKKGQYVLSPAYDLTYSNSIGGEHATCVNGNGVNPGISDILAVAKGIGIAGEKARNIAREIQEIVQNELGDVQRLGS